MSIEAQQVRIEPLDQIRAQQQINRLTELVNLIPEVEYLPEDVTSVEKSDGRKMNDKWMHSYTASVNGDGAVLGVIFAYKRNSEDNEFYPNDTFYISEIAVDPEVRGVGIAHKLLTKYHQDSIKEAEELGIDFSVQTNSAQWNIGVVKMYESFGYEVVGQKVYDNRIDYIMRAKVSRVREVLNEVNAD